MKGFSHVTVGAAMTQAEFEDTASHTLATGTSFPGAPTEMDMFYRSDEHKVYFYNGTSWVDISGAGHSFTELAAVSHSQVGNNLWEEWDLAGTLPVGTGSILVSARHAGSSPVSGDIGVRAEDSALDRAEWTVGSGDYVSVTIISEVTAALKVKTYGQKNGTVTTTTFKLMGYWS